MICIQNSLIFSMMCTLFVDVITIINAAIFFKHLMSKLNIYKHLFCHISTLMLNVRR